MDGATTPFLLIFLYICLGCLGISCQRGKVVWLEQGFSNLEKFQTLPAELIFNCTGLGAKELCGDDLMIPVKGQIAVIPPHLTNAQLYRSLSYLPASP